MGKLHFRCVLMHYINCVRLWGNPKHMAYVASALRDKHTEDKLHILVAKTNSDTYTYDGIDLGAERVTQEIETYISDLEKDGSHIKKLSIVGYSLGGLVARYAIGLLFSNGWFDRLEPVNFTTFASPHLGVRAPVLGVHHRVWNVLGSQTLSASGRQLFTIDIFRNTNRPLLSVLADPDSIFMLALSQFKHRVLYANIINDRSAPYYTTCIVTTDPFVNLDQININHLPGYAPVVLDPANPVSLKSPDAQPPLMTRIAESSHALLSRVPLFALLAVLIPIGSVVFLINSGVQTVRSQKRIRLHEEGKSGIGLGNYRIPLMVENARTTMESAFANINAGQRQHYLPPEEHTPSTNSAGPKKDQNGSAEKPPLPALRRKSTPSQGADFPTLALTPEQFAMVKALDNVGFRKYRVHIQKVRHTHAAIIVRVQKKDFDEGKVVVRHWLEEEFEV